MILWNSNNGRSHAEVLINTIKELGFPVIFDISMICPAQKIQYVGFIIGSEKFKLESWNESSNDTTEKDHVSIIQLTALIRLFNSASTAIQLGQLNNRYWARDKFSAVETNNQNYD